MMRASLLIVWIGATVASGCAGGCDDLPPPGRDPPARVGGAPEPGLFRPEGESTLVDGFPLAILAGSRVKASASLGDAGARTWMATLLARAPLAEAVAFYEGELRGRGLAVERHELVLDGRAMVTLAGGAGGEQATVALSDTEEGVYAQISVRREAGR